jgi:hypothetical protein
MRAPATHRDPPRRIANYANAGDGHPMMVIAAAAMRIVTAKEYAGTTTGKNDGAIAGHLPCMNS